MGWVSSRGLSKKRSSVIHRRNFFTIRSIRSPSPRSTFTVKHEGAIRLLNNFVYRSANRCVCVSSRVDDDDIAMCTCTSFPIVTFSRAPRQRRRKRPSSACAIDWNLKDRVVFWWRQMGVKMLPMRFRVAFSTPTLRKALQFYLFSVVRAYNDPTLKILFATLLWLIGQLAVKSDLIQESLVAFVLHTKLWTFTSTLQLLSGF